MKEIIKTINFSRAYAENLAELNINNPVMKQMNGVLLDNGLSLECVDYKKSLEVAKKYKTQTKQCFYNCVKIALKNPKEFKYYEGYACRIIPMSHAWLVSKETGRVIDPTWCLLESEKERIDKTKGDYFGLEIPVKFIKNADKKSWEGYSMLSRWLFERQRFDRCL